MDSECLRLSIVGMALLILATFGYGLLLAAQLGSYSFGCTRFFSAYLLLMFIAIPAWNPNTVNVLDPLILSMRVTIVLELFWLATEYYSIREKRWILAILCAAPAVILSGIRFCGYRQSPQNATNLGLAVVCLLGNVFWWSRAMPRIRNHGLTMTAYCVGYATRGFFRPANQSEWLELHIYLTGFFIVCLIFWGRSALIFPINDTARKSTRPDFSKRFVDPTI